MKQTTLNQIINGADTIKKLTFNAKARSLSFKERADGVTVSQRQRELMTSAKQAAERMLARMEELLPNED